MRGSGGDLGLVGSQGDSGLLRESGLVGSQDWYAQVYGHVIWFMLILLLVGDNANCIGVGNGAGTALSQCWSPFFSQCAAEKESM